MAKGQRSNHKKAVRSQRRATMQATWQEAADERRYALLAEAVASEPLPSTSSKPHEEEPRVGRVAKKGGFDGMAIDAVEGSSAGKKKKGFNVKKGTVVKKRTHNNKKASALWVSEAAHESYFALWHAASTSFHADFQVSNFHKSKKGKQGLH